MIEKKLSCPRCGNSVNVRIGLTDNGWTIECSTCKEEADIPTLEEYDRKNNDYIPDRYKVVKKED